MRILLIAALLLQAHVFVPAFVMGRVPGALAPASAEMGCRCAPVSGEACCCAPSTGRSAGLESGPERGSSLSLEVAAGGCSAAFGSTLCACAPAPVRTPVPLSLPVTPDTRTERADTVAWGTLHLDLMALATTSSAIEPEGARPAPPDHQQMRALLCIWRS